MILTIGIIGFIIYSAIDSGLNDIKKELKYRNTLLQRQNDIIQKQNK